MAGFLLRIDCFHLVGGEARVDRQHEFDAIARRLSRVSPPAPLFTELAA
jgi:hypothetical protein